MVQSSADRPGARRSGFATAAVALAFALAAGCAGGDDAAGPGAAADRPSPIVAGEPMPADRCDANRAAGQIRFLTSFDFAAAASIVDVIVASERGYYEQLCLDVDVVGSFSTENYPLVAAGQAQFSSGGSFAEVASYTDPDDPEFVVVMVEGHTPIDALIVPAGTVERLEDLIGTVIGVQGRMPTSIEAMLAGARLTVGEDVSTAPLPGFDAAANFELGGIAGITGYRSNEVGQLESQGIPIDVFTPEAFDVPGSFGVVYTSATFLRDHPSAAEDVVRATLRGLADALDDPAGAAALAVAAAERTGNNVFLTLDGETFRWSTEAALVRSSTRDGTAAGVPDLETLRAELEVAERFGVFAATSPPDAGSLVSGLAAGLVTGTEVVWPG